MTRAELSGGGRFLAIEGVDGAGKSTQLPAVEEWLRGTGVPTLHTREPGGTPLGEALRTVLLDPRFTGMSPTAELLVMFAARAEHLARVIAPALADGVWVLCERFTDATFAYQGGGRAVGAARIAALEETVQGELRPDLVLVLDVPVEVGLARAEQRRQGSAHSTAAPAAGGLALVEQCGQEMMQSAAAPVDGGLAGDAPDRFEREDLEFFRRVREVYLERAHAHPERYAVIDARADVATVTAHMTRAISERLR